MRILINACASAAEFDFKFLSLDPSSETNFQAQQQWADKLAPSSNGRLNVTIFPVGAWSTPEPLLFYYFFNR